MWGQWLPVLLLNLLFLGYAYTQNNNGGCEIDIDQNSWTALNIGINDNNISSVIFSAHYNATLSIGKIEHIGSGFDVTSYFNATAIDGLFTIETTEDMKDFDENMPKQPTSQITGTFSITLNCPKGESSLRVGVDILDYNNHAPEFDKPSYVFEVASPIMDGVDFTIYGSSIKVTDEDFSNKIITFTVDRNDISVTTMADESNNKTYIPVFSVTKAIILSANQTFHIIAKDAGTLPGPLTSNTTITLVYNKATSLDSPSFSKAAYNFNYSSTPTLLDGPIHLTSSKSSEVSFSVVGELNGFLAVSLDSITNEITITTNKTFTSNAQLVIATLEATTDNTAVTSLIFHMPTTSLKFGKHVYTADYDRDTNQVTLSSDITVIAEGVTGTPVVTVSGELKDHFKVSCDIKTGVCKLTASKLNYAELKNYLPLELELNIKYEEIDDSASIIIKGEISNLEFTKPLYVATYNPDDNKVSFDESIEFNDENVVADLYLNGSHAEYFNLSYSSVEKKWALNVVGSFPSEILESESGIELTLTATDDNSDEAHAVLSITLPKGPRFSKSYYSARYEKVDDKTINFEDNISFTSDVDLKDVQINLDSFTDIFRVEYKDKSWTITVLRTPEISIFNGSSEIFITMTVKEKAKTSVGSSVLILKLPSTDEPVFTNVLYTAEYPKSGTGNMTLIPTLSIENVADPKSLSIQLSDNSDNFNIIYENETWLLHINKPLNYSFLSSTRELSLIMSIVGTKIETALVIDLPNIETATFSKPHYSGHYIDSAKKATVVLNDPISLTAYDTEIDVQLDNYTDNFNIIYNKTSQQYDITVGENLNTSTLNSTTYIIIGITAKDSFGTGFASLILYWTVEEAPEFTFTHYTAKYDNKTETISIDNPIKLVNNNNSTETNVVVEKSFTPNFKLTYKDDKSGWELAIITFPKTNPTAITLIATNINSQKSGEATLVFYVPEDEVVDTPLFSQPHYFATYSETDKKTGNITQADKIIILNKTPTEVELSLNNYTSNFDLQPDKTKAEWTLALSHDLSDDILEENTELVLTITATEKDNAQIYSDATLIIYLPVNSDQDYLMFTDVNYHTDYNASIHKLDVKMRLSSNKELENLKFAFTSDDINAADYFNVTQVDNIYGINVIQPIPNEIMLQKSSLVITVNAELDDLTSDATLVVNLPKTSVESPVYFEEVLYKGQFQVLNGKSNLTTDAIEVVTKENDANIHVTISGDSTYKDKFSPKYSKNIVTIDVDETFTNPSVNLIVLVLNIVADSSNESSSAVLNIAVENSTNEEDYISFPKRLYTAKYIVEKRTLQIDGIDIDTNKNDNAITFSFMDDTEKISENFNYSYTKNVLTVQLKNPFTDSIVNSNNFLSIIVYANITGSSLFSSSIINIDIVKQQTDTGYVEFRSTLYKGSYNVTDQTSTKFKYDEIYIETDQAEVDVKITNEFVNYFNTKYSNNKVTITIADTILPDFWNNITFVPLVLEASAINNPSINASAVLTITVIHEENDTCSILFDNVGYTASYTVNQKEVGKLTLDEEINLITNYDEIVAFISEDDFSGYFAPHIEDYKYSVYITEENLPDDVINANDVIVLTINAEVLQCNAIASAILTIKIVKDYGNVEFSKLVYVGNYSVQSNSPILFQDEIILNSVYSSKDIEVGIQKGSQFVGYFNTSISEDKAITITPFKVIPKFETFASIPLELTAQVNVHGTTVSSIAVVNFKVITDTNNGTALEFSEILHEAQYTVKDDSFNPITLEILTDAIEKEIQPVVEAAENFKIYLLTYSDHVVTLNLTKPIPEKLLNNILYIPLKVVVNAGSTKAKAEAVVTIKVIESTMKFTEVLYTAEYVVKDSNLHLDDIIKINSDLEYKTIETDFSSISGFEKYFNPVYSNGEIVLNLTQSIPENELKNISYIPLTINAVVPDINKRDTAVVTIKVIDTAIQFTEVLYTGEYVVKDHKFHVDDKIEISSDLDYETIDIDISTISGFKKYFHLTYSDGEIILNLTQPIPENELKDVNYIPLTLSAVVPDINKEATTVVTIKVIAPAGGNSDDGNNENNNNNTGYLVAVIILSLLIVALVAAAIVFYYFKMRTKDYTDVDAEFWKVRFAKSAENKKKKGNAGDSNIENRRPTGFVFNPLEEENDEETSNDPNERRKSVLFDENVEKIHIEPTIDEDTVERL